MSISIENVGDPSYSPLDFLDYIPLISNVSGAVRGLFGTAECIVGVVALPFEILSRMVTPADSHSSFLFAKGVSNIVRASIAEAPFLGNAVLFVYDRNFVLKSLFQESLGIRH